MKKTCAKQWTISFKGESEYNKLKLNTLFKNAIDTQDSLSTDDCWEVIWKVTFTRKLYETEVRTLVGLVICRINPTLTFTRRQPEESKKKLTLKLKEKSCQTDALLEPEHKGMIRCTKNLLNQTLENKPDECGSSIVKKVKIDSNKSHVLAKLRLKSPGRIKEVMRIRKGIKELNNLF